MRSPKPTGRGYRAALASQCTGDTLRVRTVARENAIEIWLFKGERPVHREASLNKALIADAARHGQHLLDNARNDALRRIEGRACSRACLA